MTPGARVAAAIGVLEEWLAGAPAERTLIRWARGARYAGSGDRAAVRDHVYDALRRLRSSAALGGMTGRGVMLGLLAGRGEDATALFSGRGHAPAPMERAEAERIAAPPALARPEALDVPDWLLPHLDADLGAHCNAVCEALRHRAPLHLRVNAARIAPAEATEALAREGIATRPHPLSPTALEVVEGARRVSASRAYADGLVEPQDAASQAAADAVPLGPGTRVLDLCAGGGGKALALAARGAEVTAHDVNPGRMRDLPERARRAGAAIRLTETPEETAPFEVVLIDAPCSGSGAWRRDPEGKWRLTPERLGALIHTQDAILARAAALVAPGGALVHATCSLLEAENDTRVAAFRAVHLGWVIEARLRLTPLDGGDGFGASVLRRGAAGP